MLTLSLIVGVSQFNKKFKHVIQILNMLNKLGYQDLTLKYRKKLFSA